jgi:uncharacterized protein (TIGR02996 family)
MARPPKNPKGGSDPYPPGWEPFLAAINADLDDDTPRLVFADWLQENGDEPRAEFVRAQCAAARGDAGPHRAEELLAEHRGRWLLGLPKGLLDRPGWCVFRRGFVAALTVFGRYLASTSPLERNWDAGGKAIRRVTALEELRIEQGWNTLMDSRSLAGLRALTLTSAGSGLIESLAKSPVLPSLTGLTILAKSSDGVSLRSFRALFAKRNLAGLRRLHLESVDLGLVLTAGLTAPHFAGLEQLRLPSNSLVPPSVEPLVRGPAIANLRVLDLRNNPMGDAGLAHLLAAPGLRKVEALCLAECRLTAAAARALADWEGLQSVRVLDLRGNPLGPAGAETIAASPHARNLVEVRVGRQVTP